ncbi:Protein N-acetyltransferase, RimJ/RimL family [Phytobacter palmae]|nr:Protein N-acetyltransferase, RimJ/RimL family [Phytobacter palmae]
MALALPLHTRRLLLRALIPADLPQLARYRNQPEVARFQSWDHYTLHDAQKLYAQQCSLAFNSEGTWYQLAVERLKDGALIGDLGIHFFDEGRQAELGMTFDLQYQKQGYAREAINNLIALLFNEFARHRLTAVVDTRNTSAVNLLEKLGFRREAHFRQNIFFKGEWGDEYLYALLKSDYSASLSSLG